MREQLSKSPTHRHSPRPHDSERKSDQHTDSIGVGDEVRFVEIERGVGQIVEVLPRRNKLTRQAAGSGQEHFEQVIAANMDLVAPVFSTINPIPKWGLLDRYLVSAEIENLPSLIIITKVDLVRPEREAFKILDEYREIGYPVIYISTVTGEGLNQLKEVLQGRIFVLVGKSGVGKTSLINALQPDLKLRVGEVTRGADGKGRHTTTHLEMFALDFGGAVLDTPGIREFGLWDIYPDELTWCFPEMRPYEGLCRFRLDCRHDEEPDCAIRKAVMEGLISPQRYRSYMRLREELRS
jgi:ribosome biogenesis GTPase